MISLKRLHIILPIKLPDVLVLLSYVLTMYGELAIVMAMSRNRNIEKRANKLDSRININDPVYNVRTQHSVEAALKQDVMHKRRLTTPTST